MVLLEHSQILGDLVSLITLHWVGCSMNMWCLEFLITDVRDPLLWNDMVIPKLSIPPTLTYMCCVYFASKPVVYLAVSSDT